MDCLEHILASKKSIPLFVLYKGHLGPNPESTFWRQIGPKSGSKHSMVVMNHANFRNLYLWSNHSLPEA